MRNEFNEVMGYKKQLYFCKLTMNNVKRKLKTIPFITASKTIKYFRNKHNEGSEKLRQ